MNVGGVWGGHSEILSENGGDFIEVLFYIPLTKKVEFVKIELDFVRAFKYTK